MADDDEFDELFSFGNTPTAAAAPSAANDDIDFGLDDDDAADAAPPASSPPSGAAAVDADDDIFGSAAAGAVDNDGPAPPSSSSAAGADGTAVGRARAGTDDFHAHDADTRDMLDFLDVDDDDKGGDGGGGGGVAAAASVSTGNVDDILGEMDAVKEEPSSSGGAVASSSQNRPPAASARAASGSVTSSMTSLLSVDSVDSGKATGKVTASAASATHPTSSPAPGASPAKASKPDGGSTTPVAANPALKADARAASAARPTIVALPPPPPPAAETRVGQGRTSALLQSSSDVTSDVESSPAAATSGGRKGGGAAAKGTTQKKKAPAPPPPPPPPKFDTLSEAVRSPLSTLPQLRDLCVKGGTFYDVKDEDRPLLWCKAACRGRTLEDVEAGSVAESFRVWDAAFEKKPAEQQIKAAAEEEEKETEEGAETEAKESTEGDEKVDGAEGDKQKDEEATEAVATKEKKEADGEKRDDPMTLRVRDEAASLAPWVARDKLGTSFSSDDGKGASEAEAQSARALRSLLLFHYRSVRGEDDEEGDVIPGVEKAGSDVNEDEKKDGEPNKTADSTANLDDKKSAKSVEWNPLLGPVAATLLAGGLSPTATSVALSNILPSSLPLMALSAQERVEATRSLHGRLYLLACYHLPLLVLHLDRYAPGWHWPKIEAVDVHARAVDGGEGSSTAEAAAHEQSATEKSRDLRSRGTIPPSWFVSHLAGGGIGESHSDDDDDDGRAMLEPPRLRRLWDVLLTNGDQSLKFFLALAVLERHADALLVLRGDELTVALGQVMSLRGTGVGGFVGDDDDDEESGSAVAVSGEERNHRADVEAWHNSAHSIMESTPSSVLAELRSAEDEAVAVALRRRRRVAEERVEARLEEEARRHREEAEEERRRSAERARAALVRSRLVAYYEKHSPDKVKNVDRILMVYAGRNDELDKNLREKYGEGFLPKMPAINPKLSAGANRLLSTMNQGLQTKRKQIVTVGKTWRARRRGDGDEGGFDLGNNVAVHVSAAEVLPVLCAGHGGKVAAERKHTKGGTATALSSPSGGSSDNPLHFYLVDGRPDDTAGEQGRFPTATILSPEALMDPDRIQQQVEVFESLRGAVHIVVMGEGFSSFPRLYDHHVSAKEKALAEEDDSRTSLCALFFIKKGFPFVSILDGGFAAAHAWLARDGPGRGLAVSSVLVDYERDSLFAQLEAAYREQQELADASTKEKTTRALQKLMDKSMTGLTVTENRIEHFYSEMATSDGREKVKQSVSKLFERDASGPGAPRTSPNVPRMSLQAAALSAGFSSLRERVVPTTDTKTSAPAESSSAESGAATDSKTTQSTAPSATARDQAPTRGDSQKPVSSQATAASESIKSAMARLRATMEEKKAGDETVGDADAKGDADGIKGAMARFRATLEERKEGSEGDDATEKKANEGEGIKNAMSRFRATLDAKNESVSMINFSAFSHRSTFATKKEVKKEAETTVVGEQKDMSASTEGNEEEGNTPKVENESSAQPGVFNSLPSAGIPQFGTMLKKSFAGKMESPEDSPKSISAVPASERFSKMLKNTSNPFVAKAESVGKGETKRDEGAVPPSETSSQMPQLGAMLRKIRPKEPEADELTKSMNDALEGDDAPLSGGVSAAASAAGTRMKNAFGSVNFSQAKVSVASLSSSIGTNRKTSEGVEESGDVGLGTFRKKMSDIAASRKEQHEEESISFDLVEDDGEMAKTEKVHEAPASGKTDTDSDNATTPQANEPKPSLNVDAATQPDMSAAIENSS